MIRAVFGLLILSLASLAPLIFSGQQLVSDLSVGGRWSIAPELQITGAKCTRWQVIVTTCRIEYIDRKEPGRPTNSLNYFVFGSWAGEQTRLIKSTDAPTRISTTVAIEHLQQREIAAGVWGLLWAAMIVLVVAGGMSHRRKLAAETTVPAPQSRIVPATR